MGKAVVDPEELRRFAQDLKRFSEELDRALNGLNARFNHLGETWKDQEHKRFAEEFEQSLRALARFSAAAGQHAPFLMRKADAIEAYLQQR